MSAPHSAAVEVVPAWTAHAGVSVNVHVRERTALGVRVHGGQGRVVLDVEGTNEVNVSLFAGRDELARLVDAASAALAELDALTAPPVSA